MTTPTQSFGLPNLQSRAIRGFLFHELRAADDSGWPMACSGTVLPSDAPSETHVGIGAVPRMSKFEGERKAVRTSEQKQIVRNEDYEATLEVTADEVLFDHTTQVQKRISGLSQSYTEHWMDLLTDLLVAGESTACADTQFFFDTDHAQGKSGTQSNDLTSTVVSTTAVTAAEAEKALLQSVKACLGFKDDQGRPKNSGIRAFDILLPLDLFFPFTAALNAPFIADGTVGPRTAVAQVLGGWQFRLHVEPRLTSGVKFYTLASTGTALIRQEAQALEITMQDENSTLYHQKRLMQFGIFTKRGVGYGDWSQAVLTTLTT